jgi:hypothetical protein
MYASRRKAELVGPETFSILQFDEYVPESLQTFELIRRAERVLEEWQNITDRAGTVYDSLDKDTQPAYFELVYMLCLMQTNVHKLYMACKCLA